MKVNGPKRLMKRAVFAACFMNVFDFDLSIMESDETYMVHDGERSYSMYIERGLEGYDLMEAIAHEVVHLAQYVRGDLVDERETEFLYWKGERYAEPEHMSDDYFLAPWEMEARALQAWIAHKWSERKQHGLH